MEFMTCIEGRRSIRSFNGNEVSDDILEELCEAAKYAPSWKNTQVTRYYAVKSLDVRTKILDAMPDFNKPAASTCGAIIISTVVKERSGYNREGGFDSPKGKGWQMYDCGSSNMIFTLKAYELGLGTVIMGLYDEEKIAQAINLPDSEEVVSVIALGYSDIHPEMPKRKGSDVILKIL